MRAWFSDDAPSPASMPCPLVGIGFQSGALILDNFRDTNGTALTSHTPDTYQGSFWSNIYNGGLQINSNQLGATVNGDNGAVIDAGSALGTGTLKFNWNTSDGQANFYGRFTSTSHYWSVQYNAPSTAWNLYENGVSRANLTQSLAGGSHTLVLQAAASGANVAFTVTLDGSQIMSYTGSTSENGTKWGLDIYKSAAVPQTTVQQFQVTNP